MSLKIKILMAVLFAGIILATVPTTAADKSILHVNAEGIGANFQEAKKNALDEAVQNAVGGYLVSKSVQNNEKFEDEVHLNTNALVRKYEILDASQVNGVWHVKIFAEVENWGNHIIPTENQQFFIASTGETDIEHKLLALEAAEKSLKILMANFPAPVLDCKLADSRFDITGKKLISYKIKLEISTQAYQKMAMQLSNLFDAAAQQRITFPTGSVKERLQTMGHIPNSVVLSVFPKKALKSGENVKILRYSGYCLPPALYEILEASMRQDWRIVAEFLNDHKQVIYRELIPVGGSVCSTRTLSFRQLDDNGCWGNQIYTYYVGNSPLIIYPALSTSGILTIQSTISAERLKKSRCCQFRIGRFQELYQGAPQAHIIKEEKEK